MCGMTRITSLRMKVILKERGASNTFRHRKNQGITKYCKHKYTGFVRDTNNIS